MITAPCNCHEYCEEKTTITPATNAGASMRLAREAREARDKARAAQARAREARQRAADWQRGLKVGVRFLSQE